MATASVKSADDDVFELGESRVQQFQCNPLELVVLQDGIYRQEQGDPHLPSGGLQAPVVGRGVRWACPL